MDTSSTEHWWEDLSQAHEIGSLEGLGWGSDESLNTRHLMMLHQVPKFGRCVDVGCGYGHLFARMDRMGYETRRYVGVDVVSRAVDYCKDTFPEGTFVCMNGLDYLAQQLPAGAYVLACGTFAKAGAPLFLDMLTTALEVPRVTFIASLLWDRATKKEEGLWYPSVAEVTGLLDAVGAKYTVQVGYLPHDMLVTAYR